jgi:diacylglycerol kinase
MIPFLHGRLASFKPAFAGLRYVLRSQPNARLHGFISVIVILTGLWVRLELVEWGLIVLAMGLVWVTEFLNTAMEAAVDLASPDHHRLAEIAKDVSAAAVVLAVLAAVVIGILLLGPPLWIRANSWFGE